MNKIALLDSQIIRAALIALVGLIGLILSFFGVSEDAFGEKATRVVDAVLLLITTGSVLWAAYARATKPTPPITDGAVVKTAEMVKKQGGRAMPMLLGAIALAGLFALPACVGTRAAYKAAKSPDAVAYVVAEQYSASLKEALGLAAIPSTPRAAITVMQQADRVAKPLVEKMRPLRDAYLAAKTAENEVALQSAINDAVRAVADLINSVKRAKGAL